MARKVGWTESAWRDLEEVADYIAKDSSHYAAALVLEAREAARTLAYFAERGRTVPEFNDPTPGLHGTWFAVMVQVTGKLDKTNTLSSATLKSSGGFAWSVDDEGISAGQLTLKGTLLNLTPFCKKAANANTPPCQ